jgi:hypothetical protein
MNSQRLCEQRSLRQLFKQCTALIGGQWTTEKESLRDLATVTLQHVWEGFYAEFPPQSTQRWT